MKIRIGNLARLGLVALALAPAPIARDGQFGADDLARFENTLWETTRLATDTGYPYECEIVEGDMVVRTDGEEDGYSATTFEVNLWTNKRVPFTFDANLTTSEEGLCTQAMLDWEQVCDIDFVPWNGELQWVHFRNSDGDADPKCNSPVGMGSTVSIINLTNGCMQDFKLHHEIGHTLGLRHEHTNPNRDDFVEINDANIEPGKEFNFDISASAFEYGPYDFDSVMHYGDFAFSTCTPNDVLAGTCSTALTTIDVLPPNDVQWQTVIGQRNHLSEWDERLMSFLYPEDDWRFYDDDFISPIGLGTFLIPWKSTLQVAVDLTPTGGTLFVKSGGTHSLDPITTALTIEAPLGGVVIN